MLKMFFSGEIEKRIKPHICHCFSSVYECMHAHVRVLMFFCFDFLEFLFLFVVCR